MDEARRNSLGLLGLIGGAVLIAAGVIWTHYSNFPTTEVVDGVSVPVEVDYLGWIPRGMIIGNVTDGGLPWYTLGHIVALVGSQAMLIGALFLWVVDRPMTWSRAALAGFVAWMELVIIFGAIPSEWLKLAQGPLGWTSQRIAVEIPGFLVLGQDVAISWAVVKDAISGGYNTVMLAAAVVFAYKIQDWGKPKPVPEGPIGTSPYGRPLVRGS